MPRKYVKPLTQDEMYELLFEDVPDDLSSIHESDEDTFTSMPETSNFDRIFGPACFQDETDEVLEQVTSIPTTELCDRSSSSVQPATKDPIFEKPVNKEKKLPVQSEVNRKWKQIEKATVIPPYNDAVGMLI